MIIVFEGNDGSGKGTQAKKLFDYLKSKNKPAVLLDFPQYDSPTGKKIKEYLSGEKKLPPIDVAKLFYEDQLAEKDNMAKMQNVGKIIILDRYTLSTKVYQGASAKDEEKEGLIKIIGEWQKNLPKPDLTIVFDLPMDKTIERILKRGRAMDIHEKNKQYLKKVHDLYLELSKKYKYPVIECVKNDYEKSIDEIFKEVLSVIKERTGLAF